MAGGTDCFSPVIGRQLKADSASGTLEAFNTAIAKGMSLPSNVLCGVLNQVAKAGWMDECARVLDEMNSENKYISM